MQSLRHLNYRNQVRGNFDWSTEYRKVYEDVLRIQDSVKNLEGFPQVSPVPPFDFDTEAADSVMRANNDKLSRWHNLVRETIDKNRRMPGTEVFDAAFTDIVSKPITEGGTRFIDFSKLYHLHGEYKLKPAQYTDLTFGANGRLYTPDTKGTIFSDTAEKISNYEFGIYAGVEQKLLEDAMKINVTGRMDKNQNFDVIFSPAASIVWNLNQKGNNDHIVRASFSAAVRNPTLADQYLYYNVGRAILLGNLGGFEDLITIASFEDYANSLQADTLVYFDVAPIQPERVRTAELGYRANLGKRVYVDAGYYRSWYRDFLGYRLGLDVSFAQGLPHQCASLSRSRKF